MENDSADQPSTPLLASQHSQLASYSGSYRGTRVGLEDSRRLARKPFHIPASASNSVIDSDSLAIYNRLKYYNKLSAPKDETLKIPDHVVPVMFFYGLTIILPTDTEHKQSSIVTIFVLWNTMMGTSLLGMPWAIRQAGFTTAIILMVLVAGLCLYTAYRVLSVQSRLVDFRKDTAEFAEICGHLLGKWAAWASVFFSLAALLGAVVVYWVLSTNFLFHIVSFVHDAIVHVPSAEIVSNSTPYDGTYFIFKMRNYKDLYMNNINNFIRFSSLSYCGPGK